MQDSYETLEFETATAFKVWLEHNHSNADGLWIKLHKKASGLATITYAEALDIALCYGWIDGQRKKYDENSFLQKYTPRRPKSLWSKRNIEHITRLTEAGLMTPAGLDEVRKAKDDGRWDAAYDGPATMTFPESFLDALHKYPHAEARFNALNKTARYTIGWQLQTAKTQKTLETRQTKIIQALEEEAKG